MSDFNPLTYEVHNYRDDHYFSGGPSQMWPLDIEIPEMWDEIKRDTVALYQQLVELRNEVRSSAHRDGWVSDDDDLDELSEEERAAYERGRYDQQTMVARWVRNNPHILYASKIADDIDAGNYDEGVTP